jgi:hypothetical protein
MNAWQFGRIRPAVEIGERDAREALAVVEGGEANRTRSEPPVAIRG